MRRDARNPGKITLLGLSFIRRDVFSAIHRIRVCGLPHGKEGQGVTGEMEEALSVPSGISVGVRDKGHGRVVRRDGGAE